MGYLKHWNLKIKPFEDECSPRFFFESDDHREALDRMLYLVNDRNMRMGMLTGEIGSGKTMTKTVFSNSLARHEFEVAAFENSHFSFTDILYEIVSEISGDAPAETPTGQSGIALRQDKYMLMRLFRQRLETLHREKNRHLVLIFDEAQRMEDEVLDEVKSLTNLSAETGSGLSIFLVGQPELRDKIKRLKQVDQRIFLRYHLNNLDYPNTVKYIHHRLRVAGLEDVGIFVGRAHEALFQATDGIPREINRLCKLALNYGFARGLPEITEEDINVLLDDMKRHS